LNVERIINVDTRSLYLIDIEPCQLRYYVLNCSTPLLTTASTEMSYIQLSLYF